MLLMPCVSPTQLLNGCHRCGFLTSEHLWFPVVKEPDCVCCVC